MRRLGTVYEETRSRIVDLVSDVPDGGIGLPACPDWSVHDLLAHMTGNCADIIAGEIEGVATPEWTERQVSSRRDRTLVEIVAEWDEAAPQVEPLLDDFPGRYGQMLVADVVSHEHDLRGALGRPGARESNGVDAALDFLVPVFLDTGTSALGLDPIEVRAGSKRWVAGARGDGSRDLESWRKALVPDEDAPANEVSTVGSVTAEPFELMRAIAGRRSGAQVRRLEWSIDPDPYLPAFGFGPFKIRAGDLEE